MKSRFKKKVCVKGALWGVLLGSFCGLLGAVGAHADPGPGPGFQKILIIVFENTSYERALAQPTFQAMANEGALLTQLTAAARPSQPNYIALVSGSTQGVSSDSNVDLDAQHIGDLLEAKGKTWKIYAEGYPGGCFTGAKSGRYVRKHNPFISFKNVSGNPERCSAHIAPETQLEMDARAGALPDYSLYVPDMDNDGHDTDVEYSDRWLQRFYQTRLKDPAFTQGLLVALTFDEGAKLGSNHIYTALWGDSVKPGSRFDGKLDHTGLLRLVEDRFGLGTLGLGDAKAPSLTGIWQTP